MLLSLKRSGFEDDGDNSKQYECIMIICQLSDPHDDHTLDCGVLVKGLHVGKKMH